ncbi:fatty acid synthase alpha subunit Lsd1 [Entomophthora muscae]|uniref:Fatty acid synthase alpha subunit Lsd1 n=1 Tax=Entomophthora muscae TaxID=34485 RepID=A0ACC2T4C3_9FUNG|nr:fatty acid synthase alpha subunit Lsd1 [Entomophthora muscae]
MLEELFITKQKPSLLQAYLKSGKQLLIIKDSWFLSQCLQVDQKFIFSWSFKIIVSLLKVYDTKDDCLALEAIFNSPEPTKATSYNKSSKVTSGFSFVYYLSQGYAFINEVMKGCNNHIKDFYYQLWNNSAEFNELSIDPHHTLVAEAVFNQVKVYAEHIQATTLALIDFIIIEA